MSIYPEIAAGEAVAIKIKDFFYGDEKYTPRLSLLIGLKLTDLKIALRKVLPDKDRTDIVLQLAKYSKEQMERLLSQ